MVSCAGHAETDRRWSGRARICRLMAARLQSLQSSLHHCTRNLLCRLAFRGLEIAPRLVPVAATRRCRNCTCGRRSTGAMHVIEQSLMDLYYTVLHCTVDCTVDYTLGCTVDNTVHCTVVYTVVYTVHCRTDCIRRCCTLPQHNLAVVSLGGCQHHLWPRQKGSPLHVAIPGTQSVRHEQPPQPLCCPFSGGAHAPQPHRKRWPCCSWPAAGGAWEQHDPAPPSISMAISGLLLSTPPRPRRFGHSPDLCSLPCCAAARAPSTC